MDFVAAARNGTHVYHVGSLKDATRLALGFKLKDIAAGPAFVRVCKGLVLTLEV